MNRRYLAFAGTTLALSATLSACVSLLGDFSATSSAPTDDAGNGIDGGDRDSGSRDVSVVDAVAIDAPVSDASKDAAAPDFVLSTASPTAHVPRGANGTIEIAVTAQGTFASDIAVTVSGLPPEVTVDPLTIPAGASKGTLLFHAQAAAKLGTTATLTVVGSAPPLSHTIQLGLLVQDGSGALDVTFNGTGLVDGALVTSIGPNGIALQPDGKIVVCATTHRLQLPATMLVTRIATDGTLDATFGQAGVVTIPSPVAGQAASCNALALRANGNIVAAGSAGDANGIEHFFVADLKSDGTLDTAFATTGSSTINVYSPSASSTANAVVVLPLGKVLLAGGLGTTGLTLVRLNLDGSLDTKFDATGNGWALSAFPPATAIDALALVPNGNGSVLASLQSTQLVVQRYNGALLDGTFFSSGTAKQEVGNGDCVSKAMAVEADGRIVLAGQAGGSGTPPAPQIAIARFTSDGHADSTFAGIGVTSIALGAATSYANGVAAAPDGTVVVAGHIETATTSAFGVACFTSDGKLCINFAGQGFVSTELGKSSEANAIAVQPDGRIVVAGSKFHPSLGSAPYSTLVVARYWP